MCPYDIIFCDISQGIISKKPRWLKHFLKFRTNLFFQMHVLRMEVACPFDFL
jgi:hypothetical protein